MERDGTEYYKTILGDGAVENRTDFLPWKRKNLYIPLMEPECGTIGIYGGSFNPPHLGHLAVARGALDFVERLFVVPAFRSPFKDNFPVQVEERIRMLNILFRDEHRIEISDVEARRTGASYTGETVMWFREQYPMQTISLVIGSDQLADLRKWRNFDQWASGVRFLIAARPGYPVPDNTDKDLGIRSLVIPNVQSAISSTQARACLSEGGDMTSLLGATLAHYIRENGLYRTPP